jgi:hypothetical protein
MNTRSHEVVFAVAKVGQLMAGIIADFLGRSWTAFEMLGYLIAVKLEVRAHEMHTREVHAHEIHACEAHARQINYSEPTLTLEYDTAPILDRFLHHPEADVNVL